MSCPCKQHFRIGITNLQQWFYFPTKSILTTDVIAHLYIFFLTAFHSYEIYLLLIEFAHIHLISSTLEFFEDNVFKHTFPIHVAFAKYGKP